ncbi:MAG: hypothetical protein OEW08_10680, partial [Gammaproteobacteria bacterium]|nr:hypothetical protein [Gammaproteobacteria bacterium]
MKIDTPTPLSFAALLQRADHSLLKNLTADPEQAQFVPNKAPRQVKSGHYVEVPPTPLPDPRYVIHSRGLFRELNLSENVAREAPFIRFFTGDPTADVESANTNASPPQALSNGWACGYALSIYGQE